MCESGPWRCRVRAIDGIEFHLSPLCSTDSAARMPVLLYAWNLLHEICNYCKPVSWLLGQRGNNDEESREKAQGKRLDPCNLL